MPEQPVTEGPRSFTRFLERLGDGQAVDDLSEELFELGGVLRKRAFDRGGEVKGELQLTLKFKVDSFGQVMIAYAIKKKAPEAARPASAQFLTKGGNFQVENPRQLSMPLREVVDESGKPVEVPDAAPLRGGY